MNDYEIVDLAGLGRAKEAASVLFEGFREGTPSWLPTIEKAHDVTKWALTTSADAPRLCRAAVDGDGNILGWVACTRESEAAWELHPIVVVASQRHGGVGKRLIEDLEELIGARGARTLFLSTDDELGRTSLSNVDLLPDVLSHIQNATAMPNHPLGFYQHLGFTITGLVPDFEGAGNPNIMLAKYI